MVRPVDVIAVYVYRIFMDIEHAELGTSNLRSYDVSSIDMSALNLRYVDLI